MEEKLTKKLAKKLMNVKGEARGILLKDDVRFILRMKGREGLRKVERKLEKIGFPIEYDKIKTFNFSDWSKSSFFIDSKTSF